MTSFGTIRRPARSSTPAMPHILQSFSSDYPPDNRFLKTFPVGRKAAKDE
jgi:hypothetical protein